MFRLAGGMMVELWITWNNLAVLSQLGVLTAPPTARSPGELPQPQARPGWPAARLPSYDGS